MKLWVEIRRALSGREELPDDWTTMAKSIEGHTKKGTRGVIKKKHTEEEIGDE